MFGCCVLPQNEVASRCIGYREMVMLSDGRDAQSLHGSRDRTFEENVETGIRSQLEAEGRMKTLTSNLDRSATTSHKERREVRHELGAVPPNGSRLSCGRNARGRKASEPQTKKPRQRGSAILPYL